MYCVFQGRSRPFGAANLFVAGVATALTPLLFSALIPPCGHRSSYLFDMYKGPSVRELLSTRMAGLDNTLLARTQAGNYVATPLFKRQSEPHMTTRHATSAEVA
jgi:hypothetical protein